jgi:hypothetical protein
MDFLSRCLDFAERHMRRPPRVDDTKFCVRCNCKRHLQCARDTFRTIEGNEDPPIGLARRLLGHKHRAVAEADHAFSRRAREQVRLGVVLWVSDDDEVGLARDGFGNDGAEYAPRSHHAVTDCCFAL